MSQENPLTLEEQVERIRQKRRNNGEWKQRAQRILNTVFLILATAGLLQYFTSDGEDKMKGLIIICIAMLFKVAELLIRFLG